MVYRGYTGNIFPSSLLATGKIMIRANFLLLLRPRWKPKPPLGQRVPWAAEYPSVCGRSGLPTSPDGLAVKFVATWVRPNQDFGPRYGNDVVESLPEPRK